MIVKILIFAAIANFNLSCRSNTELNLKDSEPFLPEETNLLRSSETLHVKNGLGVVFQIQKNIFSDDKHFSTLLSFTTRGGVEHLILDEPSASIMGLIQTTGGASQIMVQVKIISEPCGATDLNGLVSNPDGTFSKSCLLLYTEAQRVGIWP